MRRIALVMAALMLAFSLTACGKDAEPTHTADSFSCPTQNTRHFAKTRFVADVGIAFGTFHHWIWKPYQEGKLKKGADGRLINSLKALGAAAFTAKMLMNAEENVKASPLLCKSIGKPVAKLADLTSNLRSMLFHGHFGTLATIASAVTSLSSLMGKNDVPVKETVNQDPS